MKFLVYGLRDPRTFEIRYVGQSRTGLLRPRRHCEDWYLKSESRTHKVRWLCSLLEAGLKPDVVVLEVSSSDDLDAAEQRWIELGRAALGDRLTNIKCGGGNHSGWKYTDEQRARLSAVMGSPEMRQRMSDVKRAALPEEVKARKIKKALEKLAKQLTPPDPDDLIYRSKSSKISVSGDKVRLITDAVKRRPFAYNRHIAEEVGCSIGTVAAVRIVRQLPRNAAGGGS